MTSSPVDWDRVFLDQEWGRWPAEAIVRTFCRIAGRHTGRLRVLEIGCGPGAQLGLVAREGHDAVGLDFSGVGLLAAQRRLQAQGLTARLIRSDAAAIPLAEATMDVVIDCEAIAYTGVSMARVWAEGARVLRQGASLLSLAFTEGTDRRLDPYLRFPSLVTPARVRALAAEAG
ncbi:MAG TPA: class I SAM-dependent methyltransferase, partial [Candidatus Dormibacteraeota bacterium]|nr:class I SAM-dependent methyltransferase [Candidatus Dormibacteraeota bacterium]